MIGDKNPVPGAKWKTHPYARLVFFANGREVGRAEAGGFTQEINYEPIHTLGEMGPIEHIPVGYRVTMNGTLKESE